MKLDLLIANKLEGYETRMEIFDGIVHLVAPVVILVEGVHDGSAGSMFYPANELATFPSSWNGVPVTIGHPQVDDGMVSANHPEVLAEFAVGRLFSTQFDSEINGLRSEIWIDMARCSQLSPDALKALQGRAPLEVSTGLYFEDGGSSGTWNGEDYEMMVTAMRPDHLALLPGGVGACSIGDGCGVGNEEEKIMDPDVKLLESFKKGIKGIFKLFSNQVSMEDKFRKLQGLIDALDKSTAGGQLMHFLSATYEDGTFVMRQEGPEGGKFFRGSFEVDEMGLPSAIGNEFEEVEERREFVSTGNEPQAVSGGCKEPVSNKEDKPAEKEEVNMKKAELIAVLIECDRTKWSEEDQTFLEGLEEVHLEKMRLEDEAPKPETEDPSSAEDQEPEVEATVDEYLSDAPDSIREVLSEGLKLQKEKRAELTKAVLEAEGNTFTEDMLSSKDIVELEALNSLITPSSEGEGDGTAEGEGDTDSGSEDTTGNEKEEETKVIPMARPSSKDYSGAGGGPVENEGGVEPMGKPTLNTQVGEE